MQALEKTKSICPTCFYEGTLHRIDTNIVEENGKICIVKVCEKHGSFKAIYFNDVNLYKRWMRFKVTGKPVSYVKTSLIDDSKLYEEHLSETMLTNLMITNRYNLTHSQNFFDACITGYVYEPSLDQLRNQMQQTRGKKSCRSNAIQITGGEPTLRDDLLEVIRIAKEVGFSHIQLYTNGLKLAENIDYCQSLKTAGVSTIYLNFNGTTKTTNPLVELQKKAIENCKTVNLNVVLAPVLQAGKNLDQGGKIIRFAIDNSDSIRGVHFQLFVSSEMTSNISYNERQNQCIDYGKFFEYIEQEYPSHISRDDFYPFSFIFPISKFVEIITGDPQAELTSHPVCGGSTFIFIMDGKPLPLTHFINVEAYMKFLSAQTKKKGPLRKLRIASAFMKYIDTFVDFKKAPYGFNPKQILKDATILGSEYALREFRNKTLFIGFMGFQDLWNLDVDRLKRCVIHYTTFDGIVPFCTYHCLDYGKKILQKHSIPVNEWEKKTGRSLKNDFWKND